MEMTPYQPMTPEYKGEILNHIDASLEDLQEGVQAVKAWLKTQSHLPEEPSDRMLEFYLVMTRFDLELLKQKLDYYYTVRSEIPEVFTISNPALCSMQETLDFTQIVPLPKLINYSDKVILVRLKDVYAPVDFDAHSWLAAIINTHQVMMQQDMALHSVVIYDLEYLALSHILKVTPKFIINCTKILEKVFCDRVRYLHVINYPPIFQIVRTLCKSLIKSELYSKFRLHKNNESLAEYIPSDVLPKDYGGDEKSVDELEALWREKLFEYKERFDHLDNMRVDESLRTIPLNKQPEGLLEAFSTFFFS